MSAARSLHHKLIQSHGRDPRRIWLVLSVLALYVLLSVTVHLRLWSAFDLTATVFLDQQLPRSLDIWLSVFSLIGSAEVTGLFVFAYAFLLCSKESRFRLVLLFLLIALIEWIGKNVIYQPSPPSIFYHYVLPFSFPTASFETPYSFPSGHSARSVFVTIVLVVWIWHSRIGARAKLTLLGLLGVAEIIMLTTRVSLGEHWSTDVIGGALLASALALPWLYSIRSTPFPVPSRFSVQQSSSSD